MSPSAHTCIFCLIAIPLACVVAFAGFYHGLKNGAGIEINVTIHPGDKVKYGLRSNSNDGRKGDDRSTKPPVGDLDARTNPFESDKQDDDAQPAIHTLASLDDSIPSCARDVFFALHKEAGGGDKDDCRGMLIRDDIIVTSKECSMSNHTFEFAGLGDMQAVPHASLNEKAKKAEVDARLGFLQASPPYHYYFADQPTRRTRMFLSRQPNPKNNVTEDGSARIMTCVKHKPIGHNFPTGDGEMVPLGQLDGVVPGDILWEHKDILTAPTLKYKTQTWWSRMIQREDEEEVFKRIIDEHRGPPGSISIPAAHDDFEGQAAALCEAIDPRGHRRDVCFKNYFVRWREEQPFSGSHFFDWLDFGNGKWLLERNDKEHFMPVMRKDDSCLKAHFNEKHVHYMDGPEKDFYEVYISPSKDGKHLVARYKQNDEPVPKSDTDDPHLYMWDMDKRFYVVDNRWDKKRYGTVKHTGLLSGMPALSAGKAYFEEDGAIWGINYSSGHYRPGIEAVSMMYQWMKDQDFDVTALHWVGREVWSTETCEETDWESFKIPGYSASALDQSCHEVTKSPTWLLKEDV